MRHGNKINHLGRKYGHRRALLANLASALIINKRIITTVAKAKELRRHIEPLITKAKDNSTHSRRIVFGYLQDKVAVKELFEVIAAKIGDRPGGYIRIVRYENRAGDNAEMAFIEFVDFNEVYITDTKKAAGTKVKRTRRAGGTGKAKSEESKVAAPVQDVPVENEVIEAAPVEEIAEVQEEEVVEQPIAEVAETTNEESETTKEEEEPKA